MSDAPQPTTPGTTPTDTLNTASMIALAIGNSRSRIGLFNGEELSESRVLETGDSAGIAAAALELSDKAGGSDNPSVVVASVNEAASEAISKALRRDGLRVLRFGHDMPIPLKHSLDASGERTVGQDRLMCAAGAFQVAGQACVVVDLGTAVTIDFVDGEGNFHGGAIAPGLGMMLRALHEKTAALPSIEFELPGADATFGKNTPDAMRLGVLAMIRGSVRYLAERYADYYEAYPRIVATGGDLGLLEEDGLVETLLPDLQLLGIRRCCQILLEADE